MRKIAEHLRGNSYVTMRRFLTTRALLLSRASFPEHSRLPLKSRRMLSPQRSTLKGVQRKVLDMAQTLGLSNDVLRMMERRQFWDKVILYGGMLMTLALIWFVFRYMRWDPEE